MNYELVIDSTPKGVVIALLEDKRLIELHNEKRGRSFSVGDIYLGRTRKIMQGLNAAFVDVGYEKDAFLHYLDLGPQARSFVKFTKDVLSGKQKHASLQYFKPEPDIEKTGKITQVLSSQQKILVQIAKEPISTKGPRISTEISIAGRFLVLIPFSDKVSISQKIKSHEEKDRLRKILKGLKPNNFGLIVRTAAMDKSAAELDADLKDLMEKWKTCFKQLQSADPPQKVLGELDRTSAMLRDMLNSTFNSIYINDGNLYEEVKKYIRTISPDKEKIVKQYKGSQPIFDFFGIEKQIKASFGRTVSMKGGAYLVIEHTEAMHVVDVNSGHRTKSDNDQETNAFEVNAEAAKELARQLRLRDMGGIIVVDFIDMHNGENKKNLFQLLKDEMKSDKAKHTILPPTRFGLVQITRERVRPEMNIKTVETCPACNGSGEVEASILFTDELENHLRFIVKEQNEKKLTLCVHPYVAAFLTKGLISTRLKWQYKYGSKIDVKPSSSYHMLEYHFLDKNQEEIKV